MAKLQNILIVTLAFAFIFIFIITMIYIKQIETSIDYKMNIENNFIFETTTIILLSSFPILMTLAGRNLKWIYRCWKKI